MADSIRWATLNPLNTSNSAHTHMALEKPVPQSLIYCSLYHGIPPLYELTI